MWSTNHILSHQIYFKEKYTLSHDNDLLIKINLLSFVHGPPRENEKHPRRKEFGLTETQESRVASSYGLSNWACPNRCIASEFTV